jgi:hypothetical protein
MFAMARAGEYGGIGDRRRAGSAAAWLSTGAPTGIQLGPTSEANYAPPFPLRSSSPRTIASAISFFDFRRWRLWRWMVR